MVRRRSQAFKHRARPPARRLRELAGLFPQNGVIMRTSKTLFLLFLGAVLSGPVLAEAPKTQNGHFIDDNGATLYMFDKDKGGKSACVDKCAKNWPPALAGQEDVASGDWTFVESHDGRRQWAYKGKPLYRFAKDAKPGDTSGDGVGGVWHLAKP